jgi:competence protein ComEA
VAGTIVAAAFSLSAFAVDLNTASRAELEQLNGFGVAAAARVLDERNKAPFKDWPDFTARVKGIRAQRLEQLRRQGATINGEAPPTAQSKR